MTHPGRPPASNPASVLRGALSGPWPDLEAEARRIVSEALDGGNVPRAARILGCSERALYGLLRDFPGLRGLALALILALGGCGGLVDGPSGEGEGPLPSPEGLGGAGGEGLGAQCVGGDAQRWVLYDGADLRELAPGESHCVDTLDTWCVYAGSVDPRPGNLLPQDAKALGSNATTCAPGY